MDSFKKIIIVEKMKASYDINQVYERRFRKMCYRVVVSVIDSGVLFFSLSYELAMNIGMVA